MSEPFLVCLMHPMDPRGTKVGGIETHIRQIIAGCPADFSILMVGLDGVGDLQCGVPVRLEYEGRPFDFLPVIHFPDAMMHEAARRLVASITLRFAIGVLRRLPVVRRMLAGTAASVDLQRFELAMFGPLLGVPAVQVIHGEGSHRDKMDSLIKRYWAIHLLNRSLAIRLADVILCVNPSILRAVQREFPRHAAKAEVMSVSVDTAMFTPTPLPSLDGPLRILFTGRLDLFKNPPLMFKALAALHRRRRNGVEFHYVGTSNPGRYEAFAPIASFTVRHGYLDARAVAAVTAECHVGILTSDFEGMPCFVLETLACGRPVVAVNLPQLAQVIDYGVSGILVERGRDDDDTAERICAELLVLEKQLARGALDPAVIHARIAPFSTESQMTRLFDHHRRLQRRRASGVWRTELSSPSAPAEIE